MRERWNAARRGLVEFVGGPKGNGRESNGPEAWRKLLLKAQLVNQQQLNKALEEQKDHRREAG